MSGMSCPRCGKIVSDSAAFCKYCGKKIEYSSNDDYRHNANNTVSKKSSNQTMNKIIIIVGGCIIAVLIVVLIMVIINTTSNSKSTSAVNSVSSNDSSKSASNYTTSNSSTANNSSNSINSTASGSSADYILANSDKRIVSREELMKLTQEQVRMACNELYARHGRKFQDENIQAYFNSKSWYRGTIEPDAFDENVFNEYEKKNKDIIVMYEAEMHYR